MNLFAKLFIPLGQIHKTEPYYLISIYCTLYNQHIWINRIANLSSFFMRLTRISDTENVKIFTVNSWSYQSSMQLLKPD